MPTIHINNFGGGITNNPRDTSDGVARVISNFDIYTNPHKLSPYRDSVDGSSDQTNAKIENFCIALGAASTWKIFGLGVTTGGNHSEVFTKELTTGADTDLDDSGWNETPYNASVNNIVPNVFVYYKRTGYIYGIGSQYVWRYDPDGGDPFLDAHQDLSVTPSHTAQGLVHSKDDILYIPYDNKIAKNNNGSWTVAALTLPEHYYVTSICEYGNYLAIAVAPLSGVSSSFVYLWDRDTSLTTLSDSIDWGEGVLNVLEEVDGVLIGISISGNSTTRFGGERIIFRYLSVSEAIKFKELKLGVPSAESANILRIAKQKIDNRLYFMMNAKINGTPRSGVWSVGRPTSTAPFTVVHERTFNDDTVLDASGGSLLNFFIVGDYLFQSFIDGSTPTYQMTKTNSTSSFTAKSIYESVINPQMPAQDVLAKKQLKVVALSYEALPATGEVKLYYKVDGGSWETATLIDETTNSAVVTESTHDSDGNQFKSGREYEFKIESTGGAEVTGLYYSYDKLDTQI